MIRANKLLIIYAFLMAFNFDHLQASQEEFDHETKQAHTIGSSSIGEEELDTESKQGHDATLSSAEESDNTYEISKCWATNKLTCIVFLSDMDRHSKGALHSLGDTISKMGTESPISLPDLRREAERNILNDMVKFRYIYKAATMLNEEESSWETFINIILRYGGPIVYDDLRLNNESLTYSTAHSDDSAIKIERALYGRLALMQVDIIVQLVAIASLHVSEEYCQTLSFLRYKLYMDRVKHPRFLEKQRVLEIPYNPNPTHDGPFGKATLAWGIRGSSGEIIERADEKTPKIMKFGKLRLPTNTIDSAWEEALKIAYNAAEKARGNGTYFKKDIKQHRKKKANKKKEKTGRQEYKSFPFLDPVLKESILARHYRSSPESKLPIDLSQSDIKKQKHSLDKKLKKMLKEFSAQDFAHCNSYTWHDLVQLVKGLGGWTRRTNSGSFWLNGCRFQLHFAHNRGKHLYKDLIKLFFIPALERSGIIQYDEETNKYHLTDRYAWAG